MACPFKFFFFPQAHKENRFYHQLSLREGVVFRRLSSLIFSHTFGQGFSWPLGDIAENVRNPYIFFRGCAGANYANPRYCFVLSQHHRRPHSILSLYQYAQKGVSTPSHSTFTNVRLLQSRGASVISCKSATRAAGIR